MSHAEFAEKQALKSEQRRLARKRKMGEQASDEESDGGGGEDSAGERGGGVCPTEAAAASGASRVWGGQGGVSVPAGSQDPAPTAPAPPLLLPAAHEPMPEGEPKDGEALSLQQQQQQQQQQQREAKNDPAGELAPALGDAVGTEPAAAAEASTAPTGLLARDAW